MTQKKATLKKSTNKVEQKKTEILIATRNCFIKYGLHGATVAHICKEAGVSSGLLFYHFKNMDEIIEAVVRNSVKTVTQCLVEFLDSHEEPIRALTEVSVSGKIMLAGWGISPELRLEIYAESERNKNIKKVIQDGFDTLLASIENAISRAQASGQIKDTVPRADFARIISLLWNGIAMSRSADPNYDIQYYQTISTNFIHAWLTAGTGHTSEPRAEHDVVRPGRIRAYKSQARSRRARSR
jgi:AcrR family transcriptional regulator